MNRFERALLAAFILNAIDVVLTVLLTSGMNMVEANPAMAFLLTKHPLLFVTVKLVVVGGICFQIHRRQPEDSEGAHLALGAVIGMLVSICFWQIGLVFWALMGQ